MNTIETKDIIFEDYWYNYACNETEIFFEAPVSYLNGKYPEANGCTFMLCYTGKKWDIDNALVGISPFKDDGYERNDYDWFPYFCDPEFKQALYDIYENRGKENT